MKTHIAPFFIISLLLSGLLGCETRPADKEEEMTQMEGTFGYDLDFLSRYDSGLVYLRSEAGSASVLVSPKYQGKVFTSTALGEKGKSFGWINYKAIASAELDPHMNAYGGENRLWLGPEGGQFSIFFPPGSEFTFDNWKTPPVIDSEPWTAERADSTSVLLRKQAEFTSHAGATFSVDIQRRVTLLTDDEIIGELGGISLGELEAVAYKTDNRITNTGQNAWTKADGSICIWILDMFPPSEETVVILPYRGKEPDVRADYFGQVPPERLRTQNGVVLFRADGRQRGKIGLPPSHAMPLAGSIDLKNNVLTLVRFDLDTSAAYLNQEWKFHEQPYQGDAVNAYNDGPLENGEQMGPFYELESVSPAAFLAPNETLTHGHTVFHLTGDSTQLAKLIPLFFGITTREIDQFIANKHKSDF